MGVTPSGFRERLSVLGLTDLEELRNSSAGIEFTYRCPCDEPAILLTGRGSRRAHDREA